MFREAGEPLWSMAKECGFKTVFKYGVELFGYPPTWNLDVAQIAKLRGRLKQNGHC